MKKLYSVENLYYSLHNMSDFVILGSLEYKVFHVDILHGL
jgi:hypothetical protein